MNEKKYIQQTSEALNTGVRTFNTLISPVIRPLTNLGREAGRQTIDWIYRQLYWRNQGNAFGEFLHKLRDNRNEPRI